MKYWSFKEKLSIVITCCLLIFLSPHSPFIYIAEYQWQSKSLTRQVHLRHYIVNVSTSSNLFAKNTLN